MSGKISQPRKAKELWWLNLTKYPGWDPWREKIWKKIWNLITLSLFNNNNNISILLFFYLCTTEMKAILTEGMEGTGTLYIVLGNFM